MDFGLHLGTRGAAAQPDGLRALARKADELGFAYLGLSDHIIIAHSIDSKYPYSDDGNWPGVDSGDCLDQLTCLTYAAAVTEKIRLLTSVMVIPHRPVIQTAKQLATADLLSNGRVVVGVGVGWMREELALLSAPPFERRGAASNEYIGVPRAVDREGAALRRRVREFRQRLLRTETAAGRRPADLDRRRGHGGAQTDGADRRRLVSGDAQSAPHDGHAG